LKRRKYLFDAGALSLYYAGDTRVRPLFEEIFEARSEGFVSEVNLAEFYYKTGQKLGAETAEVWYLQIRRSGVKVIAPDEETTRNAAQVKIRHRTKLSLADCFAIATASSQGASIITTDPRIDEVREVPTRYLAIERRNRFPVESKNG